MHHPRPAAVPLVFNPGSKRQITPSKLIKAAMWNDEDNNPYGSFDRRDSSSDVGRGSSPTSRTFNASLSARQSLTPFALQALQDRRHHHQVHPHQPMNTQIIPKNKVLKMPHQKTLEHRENRATTLAESNKSSATSQKFRSRLFTQARTWKAAEATLHIRYALG